MNPDEPAGPPAADAVEALLAEMLTSDQVKALPPPVPLIKGLLALDSEAWLIGAPGCRKSFVALDMAYHVAGGRPWQGFRTTRAEVVYIVAEGAGGLSKRVRAWEATHGPAPDGVRFLPRPVQAADRAGWAVLVEACRRLAPGLVVVDTQARSTVGLDENDAKDMGHYVHAVSAIRQATGACVLTIHHTGRKGGDARGSSALDGAQDTELKVEKTEGEKLRGRLVWEKQKDLDEREPIELAFTVQAVGVDEDGEPVTSLALSSDPYAIAAAAGPGDTRETSAREEERQLSAVLQQQEAWEAGHSGNHVALIKVLLYVGKTIGLTKAEARTAVAEHFGVVARTTFNSVWSAVLALRSAREEPLIVNVRGEKYIVDEDVLADLPAGKSTR